MKKLAFGADHAGFLLKEALLAYAGSLGYEVQDFGAYSADRADYPDFAHPVAEAVRDGQADIGVLVCGSGNGVCITANRHKGVRAVLAWLPEIAALGRQHNNGNVVCIPARYVSEEEGKTILASFLNTEFEGGRHSVRVAKVEEQG